MNITEVLHQFRKPCRCGRQHTLVTDAVYIGENAHTPLGEDIARRGFCHVVVVADENTAPIAGEALAASLSLPLLILPGSAHATEIICADLLKMLADLPHAPEFYIACGSGSLHDIVRYTACENGIPFYSYPTAASVDGFVSGIAAMTIRGTKVSYPSRSPIALYADPAVFASAPARLTASGVGDLLGKYICLADWRIAKALTGEEICPALMELEYKVIDELEAVIASAGDAILSDGPAHTEFVCRVMEGLVLSGLAIQLNGNSRPASGAEHHLSHFWEMARINPDIPALHGEQVGIASLLMLDYYKKAAEFFDRPFAYKPEMLFAREKLEPVYRELTDDILRENMPDGTPDSCSLAKIAAQSPLDNAQAVRDILASLPAHEKLLAEMKACGCKTTLGEIDLPEDDAFLYRSMRFAPYARNRLTFLKYLEAQNFIHET